MGASKNSLWSLRGLKYTATRCGPQQKACSLHKSCNSVDGCLKPRSTGLCALPRLKVTSLHGKKACLLK